MWERKLIKKSICLLLCFCALSYFSGPVICSASEMPTAPAPESAPANQRRELLQLLTEQQNDLTLLQAKLETLKKQRTASAEQVQKLETQLMTLTSQIASLKVDLMTAQKSLADAKKEISELQKSLATLQVQVQMLEEENQTLRRENKLLKGGLILLGGGLIGVIASK